MSSAREKGELFIGVVNVERVTELETMKFGVRQVDGFSIGEVSS
jgi:hypothetical protein